VGKILEEVLQRSTGDEGLIRRLEQVARRATGAPEQRYASASAMAQDIPAVNETGDGAAQGSSRGTDARLRIAFGVLLLGIVVLLAVGYFGGWFVRKGDGDGRAEARDPASPKRGLPEARERMEARDWRSAEQILEPLEGSPRVVVRCEPRLGWSKAAPPVLQGSNHVRFEGFASPLRLTTDIPLAYLGGQPFALSERRHLARSAGPLVLLLADLVLGVSRRVVRVLSRLDDVLPLDDLAADL